jgi:hypothetical protein
MRPECENPGLAAVAFSGSAIISGGDGFEMGNHSATKTPFFP